MYKKKLKPPQIIIIEKDPDKTLGLLIIADLIATRLYFLLKNEINCLC